MATSCRVCQRDDGARTIDVATLSDESGLSISLMLSYCAQVEVSNGEQICSECLMNLETAFNFQKQCRQTSAPATPQVETTDQKPFQCCVPCCVVTATSMRDLVLHSTKLHRVERAANTAQQKTELVSTSCPICCVGFASVAAMKNHSERLNIQWAKLKCDKCKMVCENTVKYAEHRVEQCTGVAVEAVEEDHVMECDNENTCDLDAPGKMKPHRPRPEKKHETLLCRCGVMFTQQTLLSRHMDYYCQLRFEPISPAQQKVKNVLQCDGCLRILRSPSDVARHQQNTCPAYRKQRLGARYSASAAVK
ncbi:hypothetical protein quinque_011450 [Culex quinquefasciatus]